MRCRIKSSSMKLRRRYSGEIFLCCDPLAICVDCRGFGTTDFNDNRKKLGSGSSKPQSRDSTEDYSPPRPIDLLSGSQHFARFVPMATFSPTQCAATPAAYFPHARQMGGNGRTRSPTSQRWRRLLENVVSARNGAGRVNCSRAFRSAPPKRSRSPGASHAGRWLTLCTPGLQQ